MTMRLQPQKEAPEAASPLLDAARTRSAGRLVWCEDGPDGVRLWFKQQQGWAARFARWRSAMFRWVARHLGRGLPPAPAIERAGWPVEPARLVYYAARGLPVPRLLASDDRLWVMADAGAPVTEALSRLDSPAERDRFIDGVTEDLITWHRSGEWHGGAQLRNVTLYQGRLHRIDFEEAHGGRVPLAVLQVLDLCLQTSSAVRFQSATGRVQSARRWALAVAGPEIARVAGRTHGLLRAILRIPLLRLAGYEYRRLGAMVEALGEVVHEAEGRGWLRRREAPTLQLRWRAALVAISLMLVSDDLFEFVHDHDYDDDAPRLIYGWEPPSDEV